jgi:hypothetical protein
MSQKEFQPPNYIRPESKVHFGPRLSAAVSRPPSAVSFIPIRTIAPNTPPNRRAASRRVGPAL